MNGTALSLAELIFSSAFREVNYRSKGPSRQRPATRLMEMHLFPGMEHINTAVTRLSKMAHLKLQKS